MADFWNYSIEIFKRMGPPMRPHPSEIGVYSAWVRERLDAIGLTETSAIDVLVFGVTAEIVQMEWPANVRVTAADRSERFIHAFWPGNVPGRRALVRTDWHELPFRAETFDLVVGDGVFNACHFPEGYQRFGAMVRRLLKPEGTLLVRLFAQTDIKEDPDAVVAAYEAGEPTTYHALRHRLMNALQRSVGEGVLVSKEIIDHELVNRGVILEDLYRRTGYEPPVRPPTAEREPTLRVCYPTIAQFEGVMSNEFRCLGHRFGRHPLATRCPVFGFVRPD